MLYMFFYFITGQQYPERPHSSGLFPVQDVNIPPFVSCQLKNSYFCKEK